jgi:hypothetical protein
MQKLALGLLPLVLLAIAGVALAGHRQKPGSEVFTEVAGVKTSSSVDLLTTAPYYGVQALKLWDFDRRVCRLQIEVNGLDAPAGTPSTVLEAAMLCEPKLAESWKRADVGSGQFVTSIAICTKPKDPAPRVRGIELWGAQVTASGKFARSKQSVKLEFPGCEKWSPKRACPDGTVATGVRAYSDGNSGAVGLALRCHQVETLP